MSAPAANVSHLDGILNPVLVRKLIRGWLIEDQSAFDMQTLACSGKCVEAIIFCRTSDAVLAGVPFVNAIAHELGVDVTWYSPEGGQIAAKTAQLKGKAEDVLRMERVALNVLARCSGIATSTRRIRNALNQIGWSGVLAGTRKTTPGFRLAEKYSLLVGGASQHRYDLSHMIMLKDNHIAICGSISKSIAKVRAVRDFASKIEVECSSQAEAVEALAAGVDIVMLDNFQPAELKRVAQVLKEKNKQVLVEASGGITENSIADYCDESIDIISMSCLVQGYQSVDFSLRISCLIRKETD